MIIDLPSYFINRTVLVTGAGGFIGSHLVESLVALGAKVRCLVKYNGRSDWGNLELLPENVRRSLDVVMGDISDAFTIRETVKGCEVVFHLAALGGIPYSYLAPQHYLNVNIQGTLNVLEACRFHGVDKLVHTSTSETYGTAQYTPIDEQHPLQGQSPYSASKIAADKLAESYYLSFGLPVATIRPFNVYGPRQSTRAVIPTIISQALHQPVLTLGSLTPTRDFTFVTDTVDGFLRMAAAQDAVGKVINIGQGQMVSIGELAQHILVLLEMPDKVIESEDQRIRPEASEVLCLLANSQQAQAVIGWEPTVSLDDGLAQVINDWRHNQTHNRLKLSRYSV